MAQKYTNFHAVYLTCSYIYVLEQKSQHRTVTTPETPIHTSQMEPLTAGFLLFVSELG